MFETLIQDVRHGVRMLIREPAFAFVSIVSIAVGVAVCATIFSVADGFVARPLPVPRAGEILTIYGTTPADRGNGTPLSHPDFVDLRAAVRSFSGVSGHRLLITSFARQRDDQPISRLGFAVSANFFDVMEIRPQLGRFFVAEEDRVPGRDAVAVLSHETWTQQFGSDPQIVGRSVRLGGQPYTVIGVTPERFTGPELVLPGDFYVPLAMVPAFTPPAQPNPLDRRDIRMVTAKARLRDGVSVAQARDEVAGIGLSLQRRYPATNERQTLITRTHLQARAVERGPATVLIAMLLTLAIVVLVVACANVAGLLTSRAPARARELAVRLAIGAGRGRIVRQLITESLLIAVAGAVLGIGLGVAGIRLLQQRQIVSDIGVRLTLAVDERVIGFSILAAALSTFVAGLVPAIRAARMRDLSNTLRVSTSDQVGSRLWGRHALVAGQVALSLALVTVAVFLYRTFSDEFERGPGFRTRNVLLVNVNPTLAGYDPARATAIYEQLGRRVVGVPGVTSVGFASAMPMSQDYRDVVPVAPEGVRLPPGVDNLIVQASRIDEGYLATMDIRLVAGRGIEASDTPDTPLVMLVNATMANHFWPGESPLGKRVRVRGQTWAEVVGVVANNKYNFITEPPTDFLYLSRAQDPAVRGTLVVAAQGDAAVLAAPVRALIASLDRELPVTSVRTIEEYYRANAQGLSQMLTRTVGAIGAVGLGLAVVGLYGLVAYMVSRRTREIGVRMALGAQRGAVLAMVMKRGLVLAGIGAVAGIAITFGVSGLLRSIFPSTQGIDAATYATVLPGLFLVTAMAAFIPARRASRIDPLAALRQE